MIEEERTLFYKYRAQVASWLNRAHMAEKVSSVDLTQQALDHCWQYQKAAVELLHDYETPPRPENTATITDWLIRTNPGCDISGNSSDPPSSDGPSDPYQPSRVPNRPYPPAGGSEIIRPLSEEEEEEEG